MFNTKQLGQPVARLFPGMNRIRALFTTSRYKRLRQEGEVLKQENQRLRQEREYHANQYAVNSPAWDQLLRTMFTLMPHLGYSQHDNEGLLKAFIEVQYEQYDWMLTNYYEELTDDVEDIEANEPRPSEHLLQAAAMLASLKGQTFASLAVKVYRLERGNKVLRELNDQIGAFANSWKTKFDQALPVAEELAKQVEHHRQVIEVYQKHILNLEEKIKQYQESIEPAKRLN